MMRGLSAVLTLNKCIYFVSSYNEVFVVSLHSQQNKLLGNIIDIKIGKHAVE